MSDISLQVYLYFRGNCREAMEFYKGIFGGELTTSGYADMPADAMPGGLPAEMKDWLMHASLEGGDIKLMGSDTQKASDKAAKVDLSLVGTDEARLREIFAALSEGGDVFQELELMSWGDIFGALTDKFGVSWNMNIGKAS